MNLWFKNIFSKPLVTILLVALTLVGACAPVKASGSGSMVPKYIFLFIGDGMGFNQVQAAQLFFSGLSFTEFPVRGTLRTENVSGSTTDSAAAATALASGVKTHNGYLGLDPNGQQLVAVTVHAHNNGMKAGIISNMSMNHATPAGFYAHNTSRKALGDIALDMPDSAVSYFAGGGIVQGADATVDIAAALRDKGYRLINSLDELETLHKGAGRVYVQAPELVAGQNMAWEIERRTAINLAKLVEKGTEVLYNPQGFFMMVESGKIDYAGHVNDLATNVYEVKALDDAVRAALNFYKKHPRETLIIVTADHETGGLTFQKPLEAAALRRIVGSRRLSYETFYRTIKTGQYRTLAAWKPYLRQYFGLVSFTPEQEQQLTEALEQSLDNVKVRGLYGSYDPFMVRTLYVAAEPLAISWSTHGHTSTPVPVYALGAKSELFAGSMENSALGKTIIEFVQNKK